MDENIGHMFEMMISVFLFVFALTCAVLSYTKMNASAENLISINVVNRRGTAVDTQLKADDLIRKTDYAEIALSALGLDKTINIAGNAPYTISVSNSGGNYTIKYSGDHIDESGEIIEPRKLILTKAGWPSPAEYYFSGQNAAMGSNNFLEDAKLFFGPDNRKYRVSYTEGSIIYNET